MDGRIILALGGFCVIIILGALYMQEYDFEGARVKAVATEEQLAADKRDLESSKQKIEPGDKRNAQLLDALQLVVNRDKLLKDIVDVRKQRDAMLEDFMGTVKAVRNRDVGVTMPQFVTKNGTKYNNVRVTSVNSTGLGLVHELGASRVPDNDLPEPYKSRYRMDLDAKVQLALDESKPKEKEDTSKGPSIATVPPPVEIVTSAGPDKATLDKISALQSQSNYFHTQLDNLRQQQGYYRDKARTLTNRPYDGKIHSDPAQAARAEDQAKEFDKQIAVVAAQAAQVDAQIEMLRNK